MPKYVLVYKGGGVPEGEAEQQKVMAAWGALVWPTRRSRRGWRQPVRTIGRRLGRG